MEGMVDIIKSLISVISGIVAGFIGYLKIESSRKKRNEEIDCRFDEENQKLQTRIETENSELRKEISSLKETLIRLELKEQQHSDELKLLFDKYDQTAREIRQLSDSMLKLTTTIELRVPILATQK